MEQHLTLANVGGFAAIFVSAFTLGCLVIWASALLDRMRAKGVRRG